MAISGPTPTYSNPPIQPQFYEPSRFQISGITLGKTTTVTVVPDVYPQATINLNYSVGQLVRFLIPEGYGCQQLSGISGLVIALPTTNQATVNIDSTHFDPFISANLRQKPSLLAIGA